MSVSIQDFGKSTSGQTVKLATLKTILSRCSC